MRREGEGSEGEGDMGIHHTRGRFPIHAWIDGEERGYVE